MKVRITPAVAYAHGHIEKTLLEIGVRHPAPRPDGIVEMELTPLQLSQFQLRGGAHKVEIIPEEVVAPAALALETNRLPTIAEMMAFVSCDEEVAELLVDRKKLILSGMTPEDAELELGGKDVLDRLYPLMPADHWVMQAGSNVAPTPPVLRDIDTIAAIVTAVDAGGSLDESRAMAYRPKVRDAARFAIRAATENGTLLDFDPDAMVQNFELAMCGPCAYPPVVFVCALGQGAREE